MAEPIPQFESMDTGKNRSRPAWAPWLAAGGFAIFACAAAFIGVLVYAGPMFMEKVMPHSVRPADALKRGTTQNNTMGDPNAPIHMIEYGDFQCPYCMKFWNETEPLLIEEYVNTGRVYFEYRSLGEFLGVDSARAAQGAYCAGDQGKFWDYHDILYANWTGEEAGDFTNEKLIRYAKTIMLDMGTFESCLGEGKHKETVEQDAAQAQADGVRATPTFIINGRKVEGAQPFRVFEQILEEILRGDLDTVNG